MKAKTFSTPRAPTVEGVLRQDQVALVDPFVGEDLLVDRPEAARPCDLVASPT
jgi:hypothetical protein